MESTLKAGKIYLVAAGPGDPRLLTLRAVELLQKCDVVLFDALANPAILQWVKPGAKCISVGKHGKGKIWNQSEIHEELIKHALAGLNVVRLKGGDSSIFARTGEEVEYLLHHDLSFEVVPGVTAASGASAYAGIPLTHRDWSSAVAFVTGHQQSIDGEEEADDELDWNALAKFPGTLVLYMAVTNSHRWSHALMQGGKPANTPVAIVRHASLPIQRTLQTTLGEVAALVEGPPKLRPPVVFIIGSVATLQSTMDWYTRLPLFGRTIWLTRPAGQNEALANALLEQGANVIVQPTLQMDAPATQSVYAEDLDRSMNEIDQFQWIVFSSANGVRYWLQRFLEVHKDIRKLSNVRFAGVGPSIQAALADYHLPCDVCLEEHCNAEQLASTLRPLVANQKILVVSTNQARSTLADELAAVADMTISVPYVSTPIEEPSPFALEQLRSSKMVYALASSQAIAVAAMDQLKSCPELEVHWLSLSSRITSALQDRGATKITEISDLRAESIAAAILSH